MISPTIIIARANNQDAQQCVNLSQQSRPTRRPGNEELWAKHIQECVQNGRAVLAKDNETIVGFAIRWLLRNKVHLQDIFVINAYRRLWIGQKLFDEIQNIAKSQWYKEIISDCDIDNEVSIKFHKKNGFTQTGTIQWHRDWIDSYTFAKKL